MPERHDTSYRQRNRELITRVVETVLDELDHHLPPDGDDYDQGDDEPIYIDADYRVHDKEPPSAVPPPPPLAPAGPAPPLWSWGYPPHSPSLSPPAQAPYGYYPPIMPLDGWVAQLVQQLLTPTLQLQAVEQLQHQIIRHRYHGRFLAGLRGGIERMLISFGNDAAVRRIQRALTEMIEQITLAQANLMLQPVVIGAEQQAEALQRDFIRAQQRHDDQVALDRDLADAREDHAREIDRLRLESRLRRVERADERPHELRLKEFEWLAQERQALTHVLAELRAEERRDPTEHVANWIRAVIRARELIDRYTAETDESQRRWLEKQLKQALEQARFGPASSGGR